MITIVPERTPVLIETLTQLWEKSVQASHHFLSESDIRRLIPFVKEGLTPNRNAHCFLCRRANIGFHGRGKQQNRDALCLP